MKIFSYRCVVKYGGVVIGEFGGVVIADSEEEAREIIKNNERLIRERERNYYDLIQEYFEEIPMKKGYIEVANYIE